MLFVNSGFFLADPSEKSGNRNMRLENREGRPTSGVLEMELPQASAPSRAGLGSLGLVGLDSSNHRLQQGGSKAGSRGPYLSGAAGQSCWVPMDQDFGPFLTERR